MNKQLFLEILHRLDGEQFEMFISLSRGLMMAKKDFLSCPIKQKIYYKKVLLNEVDQMQNFLNDCGISFHAFNLIKK